MSLIQVARVSGISFHDSVETLSWLLLLNKMFFWLFILIDWDNFVFAWSWYTKRYYCCFVSFRYSFIFSKKKFLQFLVILTVSYRHDHRQEMGGQLYSLESNGEVKVLTFPVFCFSTQYFKMVRIAFLINIAHQALPILFLHCIVQDQEASTFSLLPLQYCLVTFFWRM